MLGAVRIVVVLPARWKDRPPVRVPPNVELLVVVKTAPARPVTVPPMPGSGLTLVRPLTVWFLAPISRVAPPLSVRNISVGLARVAITGMVLS